jgi:hypothetical protein
MLSPGLKGAQLSYVVALAGIGDNQAAEALLDCTCWPTRPCRPTCAEPWRTKGPCSTRPCTANPLDAQCPVGLRRQPVECPQPDRPDSDRLAGRRHSLGHRGRPAAPCAGQYYRTDAQFELRRLEPNGARWDLTASLRNRHSPGSNPWRGANQLDLALERSKPPAGPTNGSGLASWGHYISVAGSALTARSGTQFASLSLTAGIALAWHQGWAAACRTRVGVDLQARYYDNSRSVVWALHRLGGHACPVSPHRVRTVAARAEGRTRHVADNP